MGKPMPRDWKSDILRGAPDPDVASRVASAVEALFRDDGYLLTADANERSISHCLAVHLVREFPDWHVDCEYNRDGHEPKRLRLPPEPTNSDETDAVTVYPDVIVHRRGDARNLLAIEIKKANGASSHSDPQKLRALKTELGYEHALFLRFESESAFGVAEVDWCQ
jgi:hypothetical protein